MRSIPVLVLFAACSPAAADPTPTGPITSEVRKVDAFHGLELTAVFEVEVAGGPATKLELRGSKEWIARIQTKVVNGILVASMPGKWNDVPKTKLVITTPELTSIDISGVVDLRATKLAAKSFELELSGVGSVELAGTVERLHVVSSGAGEIHAKELIAGTAEVELTGAGDVTVQATKQLDASLSGVGDLTVFGRPAKVQKSLTGIGEIRLR